MATFHLLCDDAETDKVQPSSKNSYEQTCQISTSYNDSMNLNLESNIDDSRTSSSTEHNNKSEPRYDVETVTHSEYNREDAKINTLWLTKNPNPGSFVLENDQEIDFLDNPSLSDEYSEKLIVDKLITFSDAEVTMLEKSENDTEKKPEHPDQLLIGNTNPITEESANIGEVIDNDNSMAPSLQQLHIVESDESDMSSDKSDISGNSRALFDTDESTVEKEPSLQPFNIVKNDEFDMTSCKSDISSNSRVLFNANETTIEEVPLLQPLNTVNKEESDISVKCARTLSATDESTIEKGPGAEADESKIKKGTGAEVDQSYRDLESYTDQSYEELGSSEGNGREPVSMIFDTAHLEATELLKISPMPGKKSYGQQPRDVHNNTQNSVLDDEGSNKSLELTALLSRLDGIRETRDGPATINDVQNNAKQHGIKNNTMAERASKRLEISALLTKLDGIKESGGLNIYEEKDVTVDLKGQSATSKDDCVDKQPPGGIFPSNNDAENKEVAEQDESNDISMDERGSNSLELSALLTKLDDLQEAGGLKNTYNGTEKKEVANGLKSQSAISVGTCVKKQPPGGIPNNDDKRMEVTIRNAPMNNVLSEEKTSNSLELSALLTKLDGLREAGGMQNKYSVAEKKGDVVLLKAQSVTNEDACVGEKRNNASNLEKAWKQVSGTKHIPDNFGDTHFPVLDCSSSEDSLLSASLDVSNFTNNNDNQGNQTNDGVIMNTMEVGCPSNSTDAKKEHVSNSKNGENNNTRVETVIEGTNNGASSFVELDDICNEIDAANDPANEDQVHGYRSNSNTRKGEMSCVDFVLDGMPNGLPSSMTIKNDNNLLKFKDCEGMGATTSTSSSDESTISSQNRTAIVTKIPDSSTEFSLSSGKQSVLDPSFSFSTSNSQRRISRLTIVKNKNQPLEYGNEMIPTSIYSPPRYETPRAGQRLYLQGLEHEKKKLLDRKQVIKDRAKANKLKLEAKLYSSKARVRAQSAPRERRLQQQPVHRRLYELSKQDKNAGDDEVDNNSVLAQTSIISRSMTPGRLNDPGHRLFNLAKKKRLLEEERKLQKIEKESNYKPPKMQLATKKYTPVRIRSRDDELRSIHQRLFDLSKKKEDSEQIIGTISGSTKKKLSEGEAEDRVRRFYSRSIWRQREGRERRESIEKKLAPRARTPSKTISVKDGTAIYERGMMHKVLMEKKRIEHSIQPYCSPLLRNHTPIGTRSQTPAGTRRPHTPTSTWDTPVSTQGRSRSVIGRSRSTTKRSRSSTPKVRRQSSPDAFKMRNRSQTPNNRLFRKVENKEIGIKTSSTPKYQGKKKMLEPDEVSNGIENKNPLSERGFPGSKLPMSARLHAQNMSVESKKPNGDAPPETSSKDPIDKLVSEMEPSKAMPELSVPSIAMPESSVPSMAMPESPVVSAAMPESPVASAVMQESSVPSAAMQISSAPTAVMSELTVSSTAMPESAVPSSSMPELAVDYGSI